MSSDADSRKAELQETPSEEQRDTVPGDTPEMPVAPSPGDEELSPSSTPENTPEHTAVDNAAEEADGEENSSATEEEETDGNDDGDAAKSEEPEEEEEEEEEEEDRPMTLHDHLRDLRKRMLYCFLFIFAGFFVCWHFSQQLRELLMAPLLLAMEHAAPGAGLTMQFKAPAEGLFSDMKVAFVVGAALTSPLIFYQIWAFVAPGLHKEEKHHLLPLALCSALCFLAGTAFCYFLAFPVIFDFLMSFTSPTLRAQPSLAESLSFVLRMLVAFGCIFELPLISFFLSRIGLVTAAWMRKVRRYAIVASFILAAILSPPDVISMLFMAGPLLILYECSILVAAVFGKKPPEKTEDEDDEEEDEDEEEEETPASPQEGRTA